MAPNASQTAMIRDASGMPVSDALGELQANSGSQFDPAVVEAFCDVVSHRARV
jgi:HD-GYP domain-containing protein (c-di-GMP phosphodiesterase class II)